MCMRQQAAIRHHSYGVPREVLHLEQIDRPEPQAGEVRIRLLRAAINPSDLGMIAGSYGKLRPLPAVAGREGVGEVDALGAGVADVALGTRVRFPAVGAWQEFACVSVDELLLVPQAVSVEQAAMAFINPPTAYCLLTRMVDLPKGSWVVQNAGNSAVGLAVIQMAKAMGLRTISQVRRPELQEPLKALGADHVVLEGSDWAQSVATLTDGATIRLALNSIGGRSAIDQIKALGQGGLQVTFGGMVGDPIRFPTRYLIFNDLRLRGFWWDQWSQAAGTEEVQAVMDAVFSMLLNGSLQLPVAATYPLPSFAAAIEHAQQPRFGKILLQPAAAAVGG